MRMRRQYKSPLISTLSPLFVSCVPCRTRTSRKSSCTLQSRSPSPPTERSLSTYRSQSTAKLWPAPLPPSVVALTADDAETEVEVSVTYWVRLLITKTKAVGARKTPVALVDASDCDHAARGRGSDSI